MRHLLLATLVALSLPAFAGDAKVQAPDGTALFAREAGHGSHGVLLLHDAGRTSADWTLFIDKLEAKGYRVLAMDLRGHGESADILTTEPDWSLMDDDVQAAIALLRTKGAKKISVVGAGLGANLAVDVASRDPKVETVVLLSPGLNIHGYKPSGTVGAYGARPLLLAAGKDDRMASSTVKYLEKQSQGPTRAVLLSGDASGTNLLDENPNLEDGVLSWLAGNYGAAEGLSENATLRTGDVDQQESQGKRYGE